MVTNPEYQHIIRFMPHGRSWTVLDKELLRTLVLPRYFNHSKFESFNRQVNGWGYKVRILLSMFILRLLQAGPDQKSYYHECFLRSRPELTALMVRLVNPGKRLPNPDGEPNFYDISAKSPLPEPSSVAVAPPIPRDAASKSVTSHNKNSSPPPPVTASMLLGVTPSSFVGAQVLPQDTMEAYRLYQEWLQVMSSGSTATSSHMSHWGGKAMLPPSVNSAANSNMIHSGQVAPQNYSYNPLFDGSFNPHSVMPNTVPKNHVDAVDRKPSPSLASSWLKEALPEIKNDLKQNQSFLSVDEDQSSQKVTSSIADNCDLSLYGLEPDPLLEDFPKNIGRDDDMSLSNIKDPDPLVETFAKIYFSSTIVMNDDEFS
ncbi:hypothetical protein ACHAXR_002657 [Thalassiosira sp. AJA248-18]